MEAQRSGSSSELQWSQWRHCQQGANTYLRWGTCHLLLLLPVVYRQFPTGTAVTDFPRGACLILDFELSSELLIIPSSDSKKHPTILAVISLIIQTFTGLSSYNFFGDSAAHTCTSGFESHRLRLLFVAIFFGLRMSELCIAGCSSTLRHASLASLFDVSPTFPRIIVKVWNVMPYRYKHIKPPLCAQYRFHVSVADDIFMPAVTSLRMDTTSFNAIQKPLPLATVPLPRRIQYVVKPSKPLHAEEV